VLSGTSRGYISDPDLIKRLKCGEGNVRRNYAETDENYESGGCGIGRKEHGSLLFLSRRSGCKTAHVQRRFIPIPGNRWSNPVRAPRCHLDPPAPLSLSPPQARPSHLHHHLHPHPIPAPRSRGSRAAPPPAPIPAARRSSEASLSASSSLLPGSHGSQATSLFFFFQITPTFIRELLVEKKKKKIANRWPRTVPSAAASDRPVLMGLGTRFRRARRAT
jgi:hypothetical protein